MGISKALLVFVALAAARSSLAQPPTFTPTPAPGAWAIDQFERASLGPSWVQFPAVDGVGGPVGITDGHNAQGAFLTGAVAAYDPFIPTTGAAYACIQDTGVLGGLEACACLGTDGAAQDTVCCCLKNNGATDQFEMFGWDNGVANEYVTPTDLAHAPGDYIAIVHNGAGNYRCYYAAAPQSDPMQWTALGAGTVSIPTMTDPGRGGLYFYGDQQRAAQFEVGNGATPPAHVCGAVTAPPAGTATVTNTAPATATVKATPTVTATAVIPTAVNSPTVTNTATARTQTLTQTATLTQTRTFTQTRTLAQTQTPTATQTPINTPTAAPGAWAIDQFERASLGPSWVQFPAVNGVGGPVQITDGHNAQGTALTGAVAAYNTFIPTTGAAYACIQDTGMLSGLEACACLGTDGAAQDTVCCCLHNNGPTNQFEMFGWDNGVANQYVPPTDRPHAPGDYIAIVHNGAGNYRCYYAAAPQSDPMQWTALGAGTVSIPTMTDPGRGGLYFYGDQQRAAQFEVGNGATPPAHVCGAVTAPPGGTATVTNTAPATPTVKATPTVTATAVIPTAVNSSTVTNTATRTATVTATLRATATATPTTSNSIACPFVPNQVGDDGGWDSDQLVGSGLCTTDSTHLTVDSINVHLNTAIGNLRCTLASMTGSSETEISTACRSCSTPGCGQAAVSGLNTFPLTNCNVPANRQIWILCDTDSQALKYSLTDTTTANGFFWAGFTYAGEIFNDQGEISGYYNTGQVSSYLMVH